MLGYEPPGATRAPTLYSRHDAHPREPSDVGEAGGDSAAGEVGGSALGRVRALARDNPRGRGAR